METSFFHSDWSINSVQVHDGKVFCVNWLSHDFILTTGPEGVMVSGKYLQCYMTTA